MKKGKRKLSLESSQTVAAFRTWLLEHGSTVYPESNPYEVIRFQTPEHVAIVYRNKHGQISNMVGGAQEAWDAFCARLPWSGTPKTKRGTKNARKRRGLLRSLAERDGWECLYCGQPLSAETATIEHIVPLCGAGQDSIFNMALACSECNHAVGNMAVKQKIAFAMQKRKQESFT